MNTAKTCTTCQDLQLTSLGPSSPSPSRRRISSYSAASFVLPLLPLCTTPPPLSMSRIFPLSVCLSSACLTARLPSSFSHLLQSGSHCVSANFFCLHLPSSLVPRRPSIEKVIRSNALRSPRSLNAPKPLSYLPEHSVCSSLSLYLAQRCLHFPTYSCSSTVAPRHRETLPRLPPTRKPTTFVHLRNASWKSSKPKLILGVVDSRTLFKPRYQATDERLPCRLRHPTKQPFPPLCVSFAPTQRKRTRLWPCSIFLFCSISRTRSCAASHKNRRLGRSRRSLLQTIAF